MEEKATKAKLPFDKQSVVGCNDLEDLKTATIQIMDNNLSLQNFVFGNISNIKNLISAENQEILSNLENSSKNSRMLQLAKAFKDHKDPLVMLDSHGNMMAIDLD